MNRIKLFAVTLVLCVTGVVYAAGDGDNQDAKSCHMNEAGASCCASGASCCDGGSCCKAGQHKHSAGSNKGAENCCNGGASCCKSGASCCATHKKTADEKNREQADVARKDGEGCCAAHMR